MDKYSGAALVLLLIGYLAVEFVLDIFHEFVVDWIKKKREKRCGEKGDKKDTA